MSTFRKDFPIFEKEFDPKNIVYLDSAATSLKPRCVIDRVSQFYEHETGSSGRGNHFLALQNAFAIEAVREKTAFFIKTKPHEIHFTQNTTDSINTVALGLDFYSHDEIIVSLMEHHSNYLPWLQKADVKILNVTKEGQFDLNHLESLITPKTKLIALTYVSNITGNVQPIKEAMQIAKKKGILTLIDAAQAVAHLPINVGELGCDFLAFSSHKMFGPSGIGVLYVQEDAQKVLKPVKFGGGMVNKVTKEKFALESFPQILEPGTPNIEGILGFGAAIDYITENGFPEICVHLEKLEEYLGNELQKLDFLRLPFPVSKQHIPIFTFIPNNPKADIASLSQILSDSFQIVIRGGFHCSQLLYNENKVRGGIRVSLQAYNSRQDVDKLIETLKKIKAFF